MIYIDKATYPENVVIIMWNRGLTLSEAYKECERKYADIGKIKLIEVWKQLYSDYKSVGVVRYSPEYTVNKKIKDIDQSDDQYLIWKYGHTDREYLKANIKKKWLTIDKL